MAPDAAILEGKTHYEVLGLPVTPGKLSLQEIKAAYHRALLSAHPDKVSGGTGVEIDLIREAWKILSDDAMRREYDAKIISKYPPLELARRGFVNLVADGLIVHDAFVSVDLDDMSHDPETLTYSFPCRCGKQGGFVVTEDDLEKGRDLVECQGCSSRIRISYEIIAE